MSEPESPDHGGPDPAVMAALCRLAGVPLERDSVEAIELLLSAHLERTADLARVDTRGVEPIVTFDPRWT